MVDRYSIGAHGGTTWTSRGPHYVSQATVNIESLRLAATDEDMFGGLFSRVLFCAQDHEFLIPAPRPGNPELPSNLTQTLRTWRGLVEVKVRFEHGVIERSKAYYYAIAPY